MNNQELNAKNMALKPFLHDYMNRLGMERNKIGNTALYHCPICGSGTGRSRSGAFSAYSPTKWHCHSCNNGGDIVALCQLMNNCGYGKAISILSGIYLSGDTVPVVPTPIVKKSNSSRSCIASADKRNAFYCHLLARLTLFPEHRDNLLGRGLPEAMLWKYRSVPNGIYTNTTKRELTRMVNEIIAEIGDVPNGVPGFYTLDGQWTVTFPRQGFLIPVCDIMGRICGLQVRADAADRKYCWVSSNPDSSFKRPFTDGTCAETSVHCAFAMTPSDTLYITEGPLKGDIASALLDRNFIAIPGISCLNSLPNVLTAFKKRGFVRVVGALDMDRFENENVMNALNRIKDIVEKAGLEWHDFVWNPNFASNGLYKGIDDWALVRANRNKTIN